jgi:DNA-binding CsgD family transcriptional regulator
VWETPLGLPGVGAWLQAVQARVEAGLGLDAEADAHGRAALANALETGTQAVVAWAGAALGFLELGRNRPQAAIEHLERVEIVVRHGGVREPGILWWAPDLIEAYWRVGDIGAARRLAEQFGAEADATGRAWAIASAARAAGLVMATPAESDTAFDAALAAHARLDAPFETARTQLLRGEQRRHFGRGDAEAPLREALATFERLGARPWAAQARRLLGDDQVAADAAPLTKQERQVAAIVGRGATNREAAEQLFLSPRTIDFHLRNIYKKLRVRSRTELAVHVAGAGGMLASLDP